MAEEQLYEITFPGTWIILRKDPAVERIDPQDPEQRKATSAAHEIEWCLTSMIWSPFSEAVTAVYLYDRCVCHSDNAFDAEPFRLLVDQKLSIT